jgi:NAD(P)-dependent dehydrogenase (short-subunit alcohol dehydrogenase family)
MSRSSIRSTSSVSRYRRGRTDSAAYLAGLFSLEGKVAAVTGAAGYLCGAFSIALAQAGAAVALMDKNRGPLNKLARRIRALGGRAMPVDIDVTKPADHHSALRRIQNELGPVDILINGAGINAPTPFFDITSREWREIIDVHLTGTMLACQVFGRQMVRRERGSIINLSSASAGPPLSKAFTYSVAKAGIKNLTQNLAREWATDGVRVNALRPGFFPTEWSKKHFITPARRRAILGHTPMRRFGLPHELVGAVLWLASDSAGFVTGAEIAVDGGFSCMTI